MVFLMAMDDPFAAAAVNDDLEHSRHTEQIDDQRQFTTASPTRDGTRWEAGGSVNDDENVTDGEETRNDRMRWGSENPPPIRQSQTAAATFAGRAHKPLGAQGSATYDDDLENVAYNNRTSGTSVSSRTEYPSIKKSSDYAKLRTFRTRSFATNVGFTPGSATSSTILGSGKKTTTSAALAHQASTDSANRLYPTGREQRSTSKDQELSGGLTAIQPDFSAEGNAKQEGSSTFSFSEATATRGCTTTALSSSGPPGVSTTAAAAVPASASNNYGATVTRDIGSSAPLPKKEATQETISSVEERTSSRDSSAPSTDESKSKKMSLGAKILRTMGSSGLASRSDSSKDTTSRHPSKHLKDAKSFGLFLKDNQVDVKKMKQAAEKAHEKSLMKNYRDFFLLVSKYSPDDPNLATLDEVYQSNEANQKCFDCLQDNPQWCSLNLGIWICSSCSGHHRSFGTHISRVKSAALDNWSNEHLRWMRAGGNHILEELVARYTFPDFFTVHELYHSRVLEWYRQYLSKKVQTAIADETNEPPSPNSGIEMMEGFRPAIVQTLGHAELRALAAELGDSRADPSSAMSIKSREPHGSTSRSSGCCGLFSFAGGRRSRKPKEQPGFHHLQTMTPVLPQAKKSSSAPAVTSGDAGNVAKPP
ncbi:unnamed protein product [Amoebophrya sp. A120]|nr:unnamed protein product [Amoebophrya sp. A120]|eukprot:GSA120T00019888001.1